MNELKIVQSNGTIEFNFEELKAGLTEQLASYRGLIFTEETVKDGKKSVAELNKLKKAMSDRRIEVKKAFMVPYDDFEKKVKELDKLIDEPISFIKFQLEDFEQKRIEERKNDILAIYTEVIGELADILPLNRIYNSKWENATTSTKSIKEDIDTKVANTQSDLKIIKDMPTDCTEKAIDAYKSTLQLSDAISFINRYEAQKAEILRQQEEQKKREEERKRAEEERLLMEAQKVEAPCPVFGPKEVEPDPIKEESVEPKIDKGTASYEISADPFQLMQLEHFMSENGITYRRF